MGKRHYTLSQLEHWTHELRQWSFDRALTPMADAQLTWEAQEWCKFFLSALREGWIERGNAIDSSCGAE